MADSRTRNWTIVVYPESAPKNWREILGDLHIGWLVSPLHDKDVNPDGETKKAHWHVVLIFDNKKSYDQIKSISDKLNAPVPQPVQSLRGMVRYLVHLDNPEKHQYDRADIENHGVDDIAKYFMTASSHRKILQEITKFISENHVTNLANLANYILATGNTDWFDVMAFRNTVYITKLLDAEWHKEQERARDNQSEINFDQNFSQKGDKNGKSDRALLLRKKGLKISEIADLMGVSTRSVMRYLNKK